MTVWLRPLRRALLGPLAAACLLIPAAEAAEISEVAAGPDGSGAGLLLSGEIRKGDLAALERAIGDGSPRLARLYIASSGGNVAEAMRIGRLIRELRWSIAAPPVEVGPPWEEADEDDRMCASACFLVYAAGVERSGDSLGIHRPYMSPEDYRAASDADIGKDYRAIKVAVAKYLEDMDIPHFIAELIFMTPSDDMYWIGQEDVDGYLSGYTASMQNWILGQCAVLGWREVVERRRLEDRQRRGKRLSTEEDYALRSLIQKDDDMRACRETFIGGVRRDAWAKRYGRQPVAFVDSE